MGSIEVHTSGDWAGLYIDGKLTRVGDEYLAIDEVFRIIGVKTVHDDAFLRGGDGNTGVAQTLEEVEAYRKERDERHDEAFMLRQEAAALLEQAEELEKR